MKKYIAILLLFVASNALAQIDTAFLKTVTKQLTDYTVAHPIEKVYLQQDKLAYTTGETIWFKVYTLFGAEHTLSTFSGIVYIDLVNDKQQVVTNKTLKLFNGLSFGDMNILDTYKPGNYHLRAYTRWMVNSSAYVFDQPITISAKGTNVTPAQIATKANVQFFPEGGVLVADVRSKVAFKATGTNGTGAIVDGTVTDEAGTEVAGFTTAHAGMGVFPLTPQAGKTYKCSVTFANGSKATYNLPQAINEGYTLAVASVSQTEIEVRVKVNQQFLDHHKNETFYLVGQTGGNVYYNAAAKLTNLAFNHRVAKNLFPTGIAQFTLFNANKEPLNERLAFIQNNDQLKLNIDKKPDSTGSAKLALQAVNGDGKPVVGSFSVSVTNADKDNSQAPGVLSSLLLTADLSSFVEQPEWYFNGPGDETTAILDILMLTQNYNRFSWKDVLSNKQSNDTDYKPEQSLEVSGNVDFTDKKIGFPVKVSLISLASAFKQDVFTDKAGNFIFTGIDIADSLEVIVQVDDIKTRDYAHINIDNAPKLVFNSAKSIGLQGGYDANVAAASQSAKPDNKTDLSKTKELKEVAINENKRDISGSSNLNGPGNANQVITNQDLLNCGTLLSCLMGRVEFVTFAPNGRIINNRGNKPMRIMMDGNYVGSGALNNLNPVNVYSVEVLRSEAYLGIYGSQAAGGLLVITTKKGANGKLRTNGSGANIKKITLPGYSKPQAFSPQPNNITAYWNPDIVTDKSGNASISFLKPITKGNYKVTIQGVDTQGHLGSTSYVYKVE